MLRGMFIRDVCVLEIGMCIREMSVYVRDQRGVCIREKGVCMLEIREVCVLERGVCIRERCVY